MKYLFRSIIAVILLACSLAGTPVRGQTTSFIGYKACCPNQLVRYDPATSERSVIANVGTAQDLFIATAGSGILDQEGRRIFMLRNRRLIAIDLRDGTVREGTPLEEAMELIGYSKKHDRLYAFTKCCPNRIVGLDSLTAAPVDVAEVGTAERILIDVNEVDDGEGNISRDSIWIWDGDVFGPLEGPTLTSSDGSQVFFIRNGRLLTVDIADGTLSEGPPLPGMQLLAYDAADRSLYLVTNCCPNRIMKYSPEGDRLTPVAEAGTARRVLTDVHVEYDEEGNEISRDSVWTWEGDIFTVSLGGGVFDEAGERIFLRRNHRVVAVDLTGENPIVEGERMDGLSVVSVVSEPGSVGVETPEQPAVIGAMTAHPNPFRSQTTLALSLEQDQHVRLEVFDLLGRRVALLYEGRLAGRQVHRFTVEANGLPGGIYMVRAEGDAFVQVTSLILAK